jgi:hypothetical protein
MYLELNKITYNWEWLRLIFSTIRMNVSHYLQNKITVQISHSSHACTLRQATRTQEHRCVPPEHTRSWTCQLAGKFQYQPCQKYDLCCQNVTCLTSSLIRGLLFWNPFRCAKLIITEMWKVPSNTTILWCSYFFLFWQLFRPLIWPSSGGQQQPV